MRNSLTRSSFALSLLLAFSLAAVAQETSSKKGPATRPLTLYQKLEKAGDPGGPAPKRDLGGAWTGPLTPKYVDAPPLTPEGQKLFKLNIPDPFSASSNDPWAVCDPFGFPRSATTETRGVSFATMPDRIVILTQYGRIYRTVWMDGRALPKNAGQRGGPDTTWYGYSVGRWEGDNTLVVNTVGLDDRSWIDRRGYPHSTDLRVEERYTRVNHNTLDLTLTIEDPKLYTKPFVLAKNRFYWIPNQEEEEEQFCVPSEAIEYRKLVVVPAGQDEAKGKK
jgi:hypothetical protein